MDDASRWPGCGDQYPLSLHSTVWPGKASRIIAALFSLHPFARPNVLEYPYMEMDFFSG